MTSGFNIGIGDGEMSLYDDQGRLRITRDNNIPHFSTYFGIGREPKPVALLVLTPDGKLTVGEGVTADELTRFMLQKFNAQIEALVRAEREQDAEPVAWQYVWAPGMYYTTDSRATLDRYVSGAEDRIAPEKRGYVRALYTAPPRREWQGLTVEERKEFAQWVHPDVLDSIEAALKEKNHE